jgi:hypothetical protein
MPKKQIDDDEDIIEIEEFTEPKQEKSATKQISDKKAKSKPTKRAPAKASPPESEEESDEEPIKKIKAKKTLKKPISEKRLEILRKGRELAAANRNKKKDEQISKLKKELWEEFNGKLREPALPGPIPKVADKQQTRINTDQPQEIISKMKENQIRSSLDPPSCSGRKIKSFCKIKI